MSRAPARRFARATGDVAAGCRMARRAPRSGPRAAGRGHRPRGTGRNRGRARPEGSAGGRARPWHARPVPRVRGRGPRVRSANRPRVHWRSPAAIFQKFRTSGSGQSDGHRLRAGASFPHPCGGSPRPPFAPESRVIAGAPWPFSSGLFFCRLRPVHAAGDGACVARPGRSGATPKRHASRGQRGGAVQRCPPRRICYAAPPFTPVVRCHPCCCCASCRSCCSS